MQDFVITMTAQQLSQAYGYSMSTIKTKFNKVATSLRKKYGIDLIKCQSLDGIYYEVVAPQHALTMYDEIKEEIYIPFDSIKMDDLVCLIIIGIAATQFCVFKGTRQNFLDYLGLSHNKKNIVLLNETLEKYGNKQGQPLIVSQEGSRINVSFEESCEKQHILTINMLKQCREIAKKYNKQAMKVVQLIKVWQAYRINQYKGISPLTDKDLKKYINLSQSQISDVKKMLKNENIIDMQRVGTYTFCQGTEVKGNLFFDDKKVVIKE